MQTRTRPMTRPYLFSTPTGSCWKNRRRREKGGGTKRERGKSLGNIEKHHGMVMFDLNLMLAVIYGSWYPWSRDKLPFTVPCDCSLLWTCSARKDGRRSRAPKHQRTLEVGEYCFQCTWRGTASASKAFVWKVMKTLWWESVRQES